MAVGARPDRGRSRRGDRRLRKVQPMTCYSHHDSFEEAGHCPDHAARYREVVEGIARRGGYPYFWLSFVDRIGDGDQRVVLQHGVAVLPAPDFSTAVDTAWLTGCNPGGEV